MRTEKKEEMKQWLSSHPDKQPKDWLLECRCTEYDREPMRKLLATCDELAIRYKIPYTCRFWDGNILPDGGYVEFDIAFIGAIKYLYDMDFPKEILERGKDYYARVLGLLSWKTGEERTPVVNDAPLTFAMLKDIPFFERHFCDWRSEKLLENLKFDKGIQ